jgi:hypothetical protein
LYPTISDFEGCVGMNKFRNSFVKARQEAISFVQMSEREQDYEDHF